MISHFTQGACIPAHQMIAEFYIAIFLILASILSLLSLTDYERHCPIHCKQKISCIRDPMQLRGNLSISILRSLEHFGN